MKKLMLSSAIAALLATPVLAQTAPADTTNDPAVTTPAPTTPAPEAAPVTPAPMAPDATAETAPEVDTTVPAAPSDMAATGPAVEVPEGYIKVDPATLTPEQLAGATVYDLEESNVGDVSLVNTGADGSIDALVVDVGGFLGFGSKPVSIPAEEIAVLQATEGDDIMVYVDMTREQLDALPEVQASSEG